MRRALWVLALMAGCGAEGDVVATVATLRMVRGTAALDESACGPVGRVGLGEQIDTAESSLARLELDSGARALLDASTRLTVAADDVVELASGRLFAEVQANDRLEIVTARVVLRGSGTGVSIRADADEVRAYVVRGSISWRVDAERGIVEAGNELIADAAGVREEPATLWVDWTGGLAEPGPEETLRAEGVGVLEARVPDELGRARWPLVVRRLDVGVEVRGDLAITEVDQIFFNPASETLEGLYRIRVPRGAVLQRFAVDRGGVLVDGHVRERGQALRAYEEQVYRGSTDDPALLEWDGPESYSARIYPIGAGETRRIVIRYGEWLHADPSGVRTYRYPMGGVDRSIRIQEMSLVVGLEESSVEGVRAGLGAVVEGSEVRLRRSDFVARSDFWLDLPGSGAGIQRAWRAPHEPPPRASTGREVTNEADERDYWFLPLTVPAHLAEGVELAGMDMVILADVSAGTDRAALELGRSVVESLTGLLGPDDRVAIAGADFALRPVVEGEPIALGDAGVERVERLLDGLSRMPAGGATDLGAAFTDAARLLSRDRRGVVVYVGDGVPTMGERTAEALLDRIARLPVAHRRYAVAVGAGAELELLSAVTAGGGIAVRAEQRREAADAALQIVAHASRPIAHDVWVDLGDGIANVFPRRPVDVVIGDVLPVVGRVDADTPVEVTVTGTIAGAAFSETVPLVEAPTANATDLRLRWSNARLRQLMLEGATREEVAELGVRYGMITPFTSYYVPSARELREAAAAAEPQTATEEEMPPAAMPTPSVSPLAVMPDPAPAEPSPMEGAGGYAPPARATISETDFDGDRVARTRRRPANIEDRRDASAIRATVDAQQAAVRRCYDAGLRTHPGLSGTVRVRITIAADGTVATVSIVGSIGDAGVDACVAAVMRGLRFAPGDGATTVVHPFTFSSPGGGARFLLLAQTVPLAMAALSEELRADAHERRSCSDASRLPLAERQALWRERLDREGWTLVQIEAIRECEAPTWRARRALLDVILERAGSVQGMLQIYALLSSSAARTHARVVILRHVRAPDDLRAIRDAFGDRGGVDWTLVEQILERAPDATRRVRALRRLVLTYPESVELALRLLEGLEGIERHPEARRLADRMRHDPLADAGVRTAIGEMLLRRGDPEEARRTFSEIVEFAPLDELARRRLGDLYLAHGWFDEAYRQYETLRELRPDEPAVLLLLARAAAGAGRTDEALRLEERLAQTSEPGHALGVARTALLWSSVRFARLRAATDESARSRELRRRMRRTGVLGQAVPLRVSLTFAHPDAQLALFAAHPGGGLARPTDISPEHGIEVFEADEQEPGVYRVEVRRAPGEPHTIVEAELCVIIDEGSDDEVIRLVPLRFQGEQRAFAWTIRDRDLLSAEPAR